MKTYIHYGHTEFDRSKFQPIENIPSFSKPKGGLWASDVNVEFGWKEWNDRILVLNPDVIVPVK